MDLIADIGATNTRCALLDDKGRRLGVEFFKNAQFKDLGSLLAQYLERRRATDRPTRAALAVAAPIGGDEVRMVNRNWVFSRAALQRQLGLQRLLVVNDFAAVAWGLPDLGPADLVQVGGGSPGGRAAMAAIGPGSGLGVGAIVPAADGWAIVAGEGGHVTLPPMDREEQEVIDILRERYGHCSAERVVCGPGLVTLYGALAEMVHKEVPGGLTPPRVSALAAEGDPLARKTLAMFFSLLGNVAGNLALTVGAVGGVFVAGGIVPKLLDDFLRSQFRARFEAKGRYRHYMEKIPTYVITEPLPAFRGLRRLLGYR
ncbi:MAG TPA: glucokinase [Gammaproteobacteria bacterium]